MNKRQLKLTDYDGFIEKFKPRKTTDDCYTPQGVYDAVAEYVDRFVTPLRGREIIRPFWPDGDYERHTYPEGCIVIDNPPFSLTAKILRFYCDNNIDFFLFAAGLTLFNSANGMYGRLAYHIIGEQIVFENKAEIPIGFITNIREKNERVVLAGWLKEKILNEAQDRRSTHRKLVYPSEVISSAMLGKYVLEGRQIIIPDSSCEPIGNSEKPYGGGMMVATSIMEELERERERELVREQKEEQRPMSPAFHEQLRRLNDKGGHRLVYDRGGKDGKTAEKRGQGELF